MDLKAENIYQFLKLEFFFLGKFYLITFSLYDPGESYQFKELRFMKQSKKKLFKKYLFQFIKSPAHSLLTYIKYILFFLYFDNLILILKKFIFWLKRWMGWTFRLVIKDSRLYTMIYKQ
jgi:hypothetical protein